MDTKVLDEIHRYWFRELRSPDEFPKDKSEIWFQQSDETDRYIRNTFGPYLGEAASIDWPLPDLSREEQVALVVLFDQFPRNMFRESGEAFAYDPKARAIAGVLIDSGWDRFFWIERNFLVLPFEHSEGIADQDRAVYLFGKLAISAPPELTDDFRIYLDYATKHRDLIRRFGRFPYRNALLGRVSTPEEEAFLKEHGRGY